MAKKKNTRKKSSAREIAKTAAAAAVAAVAEVEEKEGDEQLTLSEWADQEDDDEDEILAGLSEIEDVDAIASWEIGCREPFARRGTIRYPVPTDELRNVKQELIEQHGPGVYYIRAKDSRGKWVKGSYRTIRISPSAKPPVLAGSSPTSGSASNDPLAIVRELELREERRRAERKSEWRGEIKFWSPLLLAIAPKLVESLFGRGESVKDLVQALAAMKSLNGDQANPWIDQVKSIIELSRELNGGSDKGSTWPDLAKEALTSLAPAVKHALEQRTGGANAAAGVASSPVHPALTAPPQNGGATGVDPMWAIVEPLLKKLGADLQDFAEAGAKAELAAEALYAKIPQGILSMVPAGQLEAWLTQPNWWAAVTAFYPQLTPYHAYADSVREILLEIVQEEQQPPQDPTTQASENA